MAATAENEKKATLHHQLNLAAAQAQQQQQQQAAAAAAAAHPNPSTSTNTNQTAASNNTVVSLPYALTFSVSHIDFTFFQISVLFLEFI